MTKIYVDTGIFLDYLSKRSLGGAPLRAFPRRSRNIEKLAEDATAVLKKIADSHTGATSCLTYYEAEEALHKVWESQAKGAANASNYRILAARSIVQQVAMAVEFYCLQTLDLTAHIVSQQLNEPILHIRGVRAADTLHVCTAINFGAEMIITSDDDMLQLDNLVQNNKGMLIRCVDSDLALSFL